MGALGPWPLGPIGDGVGPLWDWGVRAIFGSDFHFGRGLFKPKQHLGALECHRGRLSALNRSRPTTSTTLSNLPSSEGSTLALWGHAKAECGVIDRAPG